MTQSFQGLGVVPDAPSYLVVVSLVEVYIQDDARLCESMQESLSNATSCNDL